MGIIGAAGASGGLWGAPGAFGALWRATGGFGAPSRDTRSRSFTNIATAIDTLETFLIRKV